MVNETVWLGFNKQLSDLIRDKTEGVLKATSCDTED